MLGWGEKAWGTFFVIVSAHHFTVTPTPRTSLIGHVAITSGRPDRECGELSR